MVMPASVVPPWAIRSSTRSASANAACTCQLSRRGVGWKAERCRPILSHRAFRALRARTSVVASWRATSSKADQVSARSCAQGPSARQVLWFQARGVPRQAAQRRTARLSGEALTCTAQAVSAAAVFLVRGAHALTLGARAVDKDIEPVTPSAADTRERR